MRKEEFGGGPRKSVCELLAGMLAAVAAELHIARELKGQFHFRTIESSRIVSRKSR